MCGEQTKGHLGPYGAKCIQGIFLKFTTRIDELEKDVKAKGEQLRQHEKLSIERQEALLATIAALEEQVLQVRPDQVSESAHDHSCKSRSRRSETGQNDEFESTHPESTNSCKSAAVQLDDMPETSNAKETSLSTQHALESRTNLEKKGKIDKRCKEPPLPSQRTILVHTNPVVIRTTTVEPPSSATSPASECSETTRRGSAANEDCTSRNHGDSNGSDAKAIEGHWRVQGRRRHAKPLPAGLYSKLYGSGRIVTRPFHLSGIGLDCCSEDVIQHCKERGVTVTGCLFIRTRIWGTQSAKLFVADKSVSEVISECFWPDFIKCRRWEATPPHRPASQN